MGIAVSGMAWPGHRAAQHCDAPAVQGEALARQSEAQARRCEAVYWH